MYDDKKRFVYQMKSRVRYSEVDQKGNLTIVAMINYLQDCSSFHSDSIGYGLDYLSERGLGWFITNWQIHVHALPRYGDEIVISTWAQEFKGILAHRNFAIDDADGTRLMESKSLWVLMDLNAGCPARIPKEIIRDYGIGEDLPGQWGGRKVALFDQDSFTTQEHSVEVMPVHLDTNRHMNNAYYIEFARDVLPKDKKVFGIRTEYRKAAQLGDMIRIRIAEQDDVTQVLLEDIDGAIFAIVEFVLG